MHNHPIGDIIEYIQDLIDVGDVEAAEAALGDPRADWTVNHWILKAQCLEDLGESEDALDAWETAWNICHRDLDPLGREQTQTRILINLGGLTRILGDAHSAIDILERAQHLIGQYGSNDLETDLNIASVSINLAECLSDLGDADQSVEILSEALERPDFGGPISTGLRALALNNLGNSLREAGQLEASTTILNEALELRRTAAELGLKHRAGLAQTLYNFSNTLEEKRHFTRGIRFAREAAEILESLIDEGHDFRLDHARGLNTLGIMLWRTNNLLDAERILRRALKIHQSLIYDAPDRQLRMCAETEGNLAIVLDDAGKVEDAQRAYQSSSEAFARLGRETSDHYAQSLINMAAHSLEAGEGAKASVLIEEALSIFDETSDRGDLSVAHSILGRAMDLSETGRGLPAHQSAVSIMPTDSWRFREIIASRRAEVRQVADLDLKFAMIANILGGSDEADISAFKSELRKANDQFSKKHVVITILNADEGGPAQFLAITADNLAGGILPDRREAANLIVDAWPAPIADIIRQAIQGEVELLIGAESLWLEFAWERLRASWSHLPLGCCAVLPRLATLSTKDLHQTLSESALGSGSTAGLFVAPQLDGPKRLPRSIDEIHQATDAWHSTGNTAHQLLGSNASIEAVISGLKTELALFYFAGHADKIDGEEVLRLYHRAEGGHRDPWFGRDELRVLMEVGGGRHFSNRPLLILNACQTGNMRSFGGIREDLVASFMQAGAGAVLASTQTIRDDQAGEFAHEFLSFNGAKELGRRLIEARRNCFARNPDSVPWWSFILHGSPYARTLL